MVNFNKHIGASGVGLAAAISGIVGLSATALAQPNSTDLSRYIAPLHSLNHSGVTGFANLTLNSTQPGAELTASVNARGTEPSQIHAMHIHGMLDGKDAECPTTAADTNNDSLVSVFEGAPFYGPIKVSFTDPVTPFGAPSNTVLFAPFAGSPITSDFPHSNASGKLSYNKTIPFDASNHFAVEALASLTPLNAQHIVLHGGYAPESVDTPGGDPNKIVYDGLLPIACGRIIQTHRGSSGSQGQSGSGNENGDSNSISNTGPGSNNSITSSSSTKVRVTNTSDVRVTNHSNQTSTSGSAAVKGNTSGGSASSGDASNSSMMSVMVRLMNSVFSLR